MASPAQTPQPPPRSRWHDWWKFPLFFGIIAAALALEGYLNSKGAVLLLLLMGYILVRGLRAIIGRQSKS